MRGKPVLGGPAGAVCTSEYFAHPVAIQIHPKVEVLFGFRTYELSWVGSRTEDHGISERCAKLALAEAWHGVKVTLDSGTMSAHCSSHAGEWLSYKNGVQIRNLVAALFWDYWNREGFTFEARAAALTESGYPCTKRQLERFAVDHGL